MESNIQYVTEAEILSWTGTQVTKLGYFDLNMVTRVWQDNDRIVREFPDSLYPDGVSPYSEAGFAAVREFLDAENAHYYAEEKENFFLSSAVSDAARAGKTKVYVENLS